MKENCDTVIKADGEKEDRPAKWQTGLREALLLLPRKKVMCSDMSN